MAVNAFGFSFSSQNIEAIAASLFLDSPCRVMIVRRTTELLEINEVGAKFLQSSRESLLGTLLVDHYPVEVRETVLKWFSQPFDSPEGTVSGEYVLGGQRWMSRGRRISVLDGQDGIICVSQPLVDLIPLARLQEMIAPFRLDPSPFSPIVSSRSPRCSRPRSPTVRSPASCTAASAPSTPTGEPSAKSSGCGGDPRSPN